jgi:hypothetical protein
LYDSKSRNRYLLDAFFFETAGTKKKALQKRNAASSGAARTRELFKKSSTKNYFFAFFIFWGVRGCLRGNTKAYRHPRGIGNAKSCTNGDLGRGAFAAAKKGPPLIGYYAY